ncbi:MAG: pseudouridine synthase [Thermovenabulum sp.]|uniref:pseudouridine synthase n=1 Tax=Thermovenabulum sp. TaxID=3100335 RepID=UPI003C7C77B3
MLLKIIKDKGSCLLELRLQKFLSMAGVASRRAAEELISQKRVKVNGVTVTKPGIKIDTEKDTVEVDGKVCELKNTYVYIMLNKPKGYITTLYDPFGRPTILDLVKGLKTRVFPVGRLDKDTEGLLLLTNDGELAYKLTHPKHGIEKTYIVKVKGKVSKKAVNVLQKGVILEEGKTSPAKVRILKSGIDFTILEVKIHEGKKRQIRRMCEKVGHPVIELKRIKIGELTLKGLKAGEWRHLTNKEIEYLKNL